MRRKPRRRRDDSGGDGAAPSGRERRSQSEGPLEPSDQVDHHMLIWDCCVYWFWGVFGWFGWSFVWSVLVL